MGWIDKSLGSVGVLVISLYSCYVLESVLDRD